MVLALRLVAHTLSSAPIAMPKPGPSMPPPRNPTVIGDRGLPFGRSSRPRRRTGPDRRLCAAQEVVVRPHVAFAINRDATQRVQPTAGIHEREGPRTRREAEIRDERHVAPELSVGHGIELIEQSEQLLCVMRRIRATFCAAVSVSVGAVPPGGVAAAKNLSHASPRARVRAPASRFASVLNVASVVVCELFRGSWITGPKPPVLRSTRFGTFPRRSSGRARAL